MTKNTIWAMRFWRGSTGYFTGGKQLEVRLKINDVEHIIESPICEDQRYEMEHAALKVEHMIKDKLFAAVFPDGLIDRKIIAP